MHQLYLDEPDDPLDLSFRPPRRAPKIVWEDRETEELALRYARSVGQRAMLTAAFCDVDREKCNLRQRLENAGFKFQCLGRERPNSANLYRIYMPRSSS
jgi:hypothetical protein